jgi:hypothetical protein
MAEAKCNKCGLELDIHPGHIGKKHKHCGGRKSDGSSKNNCGTWISKKSSKGESNG